MFGLPEKNGLKKVPIITLNLILEFQSQQSK